MRTAPSMASTQPWWVPRQERTARLTLLSLEAPVSWEVMASPSSSSTSSSSEPLISSSTPSSAAHRSMVSMKRKPFPRPRRMRAGAP